MKLSKILKFVRPRSLMKALAAAALTLGFFSAARASTLISCPGSEIVSNVLVHVETGFRCSDTTQFLKVFDQVQSISSTKIHLSQLVIVAPAKGVDIGYDMQRSSLRIVAKTSAAGDPASLEGRWSQRSALSLPHEIGHMLLDAMMAGRFPLMEKLIGLQIADASLQKCRRESPRESCEEELKIHGLSLKWNAFNAQHSREVLRLFTIAKPYHELFADLVAALHFEDSEAISRMIDNFNNTSNTAINACRSFTFNTPPGFQATSEHCTLSEIRYDLWESLGLFKRKPWPRKQILDAVAGVLISEIEYLMGHPEVRLTQDQATRRLRTAFRLP